MNTSELELPIVFNAAEAKEVTTRLLYLAWLERYDVTLTLPPTYQNLEPGDPITVTTERGTLNLRLTSINYLPDGRLDCKAKYDAPAVYTQTGVADEGQSTGATLTLAGPSVYVLLDIPLMDDNADQPGFVAAMTGYYTGWPGGILYRSEDGGQSWVDVESAVSPGSSIGYATNALAAHGSTYYDASSTLTVRMYQGAISSVTEAQLFAGTNWFAYGAHGRWEIIAARTATLQGDGSYILQDFLRGQQGTEWATGLHVANDSLVRLATTSVAFIKMNSASIGSEKLYRGITAGKALDSDADRAFTYTGVNLECLSPINLTGDRHPSTNQWTLYWTRRSRFAGWRDYVDAALGEASESYEVDIFSDGTYTTLKRTLTSTTPTVTYSSANQVTDFGSNQATLYVKIYQLSATVGRGYPLTQSITR
jgi:hypothetical protein